MSVNNLNWLLVAAAIGLIAIAAVLILRWLRLLLRRRGVVISDTSVITNLAAVGLLHLLYDLYATPHGALYVPPQVYREMRRKSPRNIGRQAVTEATLRAEPMNFRVAQRLYEQVLRDLGEI